MQKKMSIYQVEIRITSNTRKLSNMAYRGLYCYYLMDKKYYFILLLEELSPKSNQIFIEWPLFFKIALSFFNNSLRVSNISQVNNYNLHIDIHDWRVNKKKSSHDNSLIILTFLHVVSWCAKGTETSKIRQINFTLTLSSSNTSPITGLTEILLVIKTASIGAVIRKQSRASTDVVNCDLTGDRLSVEVVHKLQVQDR